MQSRWNDNDAQAFITESELKGQDTALGLRIYTSRLIGQEPDLVLHGGGNTSVKIPKGDGGSLIHVKGSGWDLEHIEAPGLPALRLDSLLTTRDIPHMSDEDMVAFLRAHLIDSSAPNPSIETLLHAYMPHTFVDHTHATAILALSNQSDMKKVVQEIYDGRVGFVPYVMPGYALSHACSAALSRDPNVDGLWLEQHGLFTFAETARGSYELMIEFVTLAESYLADRGIKVPGPQKNDRESPEGLTEMLRDALLCRGVFNEGAELDFRSTPSIRTYLERDNLEELTRRGTVTPDHVIRIKPFGMCFQSHNGRAGLDQAIDEFIEEYCAYFERNASNATEKKIILDSLPRAILVPGIGLYGVGVNKKAAQIAGDLLEQTSRIVNAAEDYKRFTPISEWEMFNMEYWSLEQEKLKMK